MKTRTIIFALAMTVVATSLVCSCKTSQGGQENNSIEEIKPGDLVDDPHKAVLVGGYTEKRVPTEEEIEFFKTVVGAEAEGLTPEAVATQVVAGLNYKFFCPGTDADGKQIIAEIVIYKPLQDEPKVTSMLIYNKPTE